MRNLASSAASRNLAMLGALRASQFAVSAKSSPNSLNLQKLLLVFRVCVPNRHRAVTQWPQ